MSVSQLTPTPDRWTVSTSPLTRAGSWPMINPVRPARRIAATRRPDIDPDILRKQVVGMVNDGTVSIEGGNALLESFDMPPVRGDCPVTFRVNARIRTAYDGMSRTIEHAAATIADELSQLRWTSFEGCPEGFGIDDPITTEGPYGRRYGTVQTALRLTVTVPAYEEELLEQTALDLLCQDLGRLCHVQPVLTRITPWFDDTSGGDGRLEPGYVDDDIRLVYADCAWAEVDQ